MQLSVSFEDGRTVDVQIKQGDMARLERITGKSVADINIGAEVLLRLAWLACVRLGIEGVPAEFDDFMDIAEAMPGEDDAPKALG
jgi:hypothetical protein